MSLKKDDKVHVCRPGVVVRRTEIHGMVLSNRGWSQENPFEVMLEDVRSLFGSRESKENHRQHVTNRREDIRLTVFVERCKVNPYHSQQEKDYRWLAHHFADGAFKRRWTPLITQWSSSLTLQLLADSNDISYTYGNINPYPTHTCTMYIDSFCLGITIIHFSSPGPE